MKTVLLIAQRDLAAYFSSLVGLLVITLLLFAEGMAFQGVATMDKELLSSEVLAWFFRISFGFTCVAGVMISMRSLSVETRDQSIVVLFTAPISEWQVVLG